MDSTYMTQTEHTLHNEKKEKRHRVSIIQQEKCSVVRLGSFSQ